MSRRIATTLGLAAVLLGLVVAPAAAAPVWEVQLTRNPPFLPEADPDISRSDERVDYTVVARNVGDSPTAGAAAVTVELPSGSQSFAFMGTGGTGGPGWTCSAQPAAGAMPARAVCQRSDALSAGNSYQPLRVAIGLGADAPDPSTIQATVEGGGAATASATDQLTFEPLRPFEILAFETAVENVDASDFQQAGGHPHRASTSFKFPLFRNVDGGGAQGYSPVERVKNIIVDVPRGFVGNALAIPDGPDADEDPDLCPGLEDVLADTCPVFSLVGGIDPDVLGGLQDLPIYAIEPEFGVPAQFAFKEKESRTTYTFVPKLRASDNYAISFEASPTPVHPSLRGVSEVTLCDFGATKRPDTRFLACRESSDPLANDVPLVTVPTRCTGQLPTSTLTVDTWENPGTFHSRQTTDPLPEGCEKVPFEPDVDLSTTGGQADSPTGLDVELRMPTDGLEDPDGIAQATLKRTRIHFPEGMAINPSAGHGLQSCSAEQVKLETNLPISCPGASKVGTIEIETPLIQETLKGATYVARQSDAPPGALIGLYLVFESAKDGIIIKIAGGVKPDPVTGQLVATFDELPEQPFSSVTMHFPQGPRASLLAPPRCGTYEIKAEFVPWTIEDLDNPTAAETVTRRSSFQVTEGPGGMPCPDGRLAPSLDAGTTNPMAGQTSPFLLRLTREDGTQRFAGLDLKTPPGLTAYLKGIPYCSDAALASISTAVETGQAQIDNPSCPAASLVGSASAGAGAGPNPFYVETGKVYLAGPYKGAPLSLAIVTPAVAGPLDLGNVVVRTALYVDPVTAQITAVSDPIPTILHGLLLDIRDIRVSIDRPNFTLNPTNCEPMSVQATVKGDKGQSALLANRFQVDGCRNLGFKPRISLSLKGGTKRADHPALKAVLRPRPGDANVQRAAVTLPRSAFLDQAHIRTICTRVQWAEDNCPKAAIYGRAEAVTPLLDEPLSGPVYLRSSDNLLPDLVADLRGPAHLPIKVEASFRTDSIKGGIRSTIDLAPDAPVTKFVLQMQGGKKGLVVNSQNLCAKTNRANARLRAQNGRMLNFRPKVVALNCAKQRKRKAGHDRRAG
ncbi:MAG TPA: hypothetical protein VFY04_06175 [Solirubrobacterales bacterium]|nr:hypothetical protein [Solirubrobacterales bacterium]